MAAASAAKLGIKCNAYRNTGSYGTPVWSAMTAVVDASVNPSWKEGDSSSRASRAELAEATMLALALELNVKADDLFADYIALWNQFAAATAGGMDLLVLNGDQAVEGVRGWRAFFQIFGAPEEQGKDNVVYDKFSLKPCFNVGGYPKYAVVGPASAITYTAVGS